MRSRWRPAAGSLLQRQLNCLRRASITVYLIPFSRRVGRQIQKLWGTDNKEVIIEKSALISFPVKPLQIRQSLCVTGLFSYLEFVIGCNVSNILRKNDFVPTNLGMYLFHRFQNLFLNQIQHCPVRTFRTFLSLFGICTRAEKHTQKSSALLCCEDKCQMGGGGYSHCVLELCDTTSTSLRLWNHITGADLCSRGHVKARPAPKRISSLNVSAVATWWQKKPGGAAAERQEETTSNTHR